MAENLAIDRILALLHREPTSTRLQRRNEAAVLLDAKLGDGSTFFLALLKRAIATNAESEPELLDLVSYLTDDDLQELAADLVSVLSGGQEVASSLADDLMEHAACQKPDVFSRELLEEILDFKFWFETADPINPPPTYHLVFAGGSPLEMPFETHRQHPTWHLDDCIAEISIGGRGTQLCPACGARLIRLLTLDQNPADIGVSLPRLEIETCPSSWSESYYRHDRSGRPTAISLTHEYSFPCDDALAETRVKLARTPDRWKLQSWMVSNSRENLFKLGGLPSWIQDVAIPTAPGTDRPMQFLAQLDSGLPASDGNEVMWGSGGILYIFWDDLSRTSCVFGQWS